jgi:hypothetical protein
MALLASCAATLSAQAAKIADADEASVARCEFLGQVQGYVAASTGKESARNEAREKAARLGATDIVWRPVSTGYSPYVSGRAYDCRPPRL